MKLELNLREESGEGVKKAEVDFITILHLKILSDMMNAVKKEEMVLLDIFQRFSLLSVSVPLYKYFIYALCDAF